MVFQVGGGCSTTCESLSEATPELANSLRLNRMALPAACPSFIRDRSSVLPIPGKPGIPKPRLPSPEFDSKFRWKPVRNDVRFFRCVKQEKVEETEFFDGKSEIAAKVEDIEPAQAAARHEPIADIEGGFRVPRATSGSRRAIAG